ncbi:isochorismate synthase [Streptomyces boninensis]|uniref:isochorismate synthase n=1 Tax=Streptomyces boninensis TaxID=2039455 RepID=UPI003B2168B7
MTTSTINQPTHTPTPTTPTPDFADFGPASSYLHRSPHRTLHATGIRTTLPLRNGTTTDAAAALHRLLDAAGTGDHAPTVATGVLPFHPEHTAELLVPHTAHFTGSPRATGPAPAPAPPGRWQHRAVPEPADYRRAVSRVLDQLGTEDLHKVVLARTLHLTGPQPIDVPALLRRLAHREPHAHTFAVQLPAAAAGDSRRLLIGASPELLVSRNGTAVTSHPLAGSAPRTADPLADHERAERLLRSAKDGHEHAIVVEAITDTLTPYCRKLRVPRHPSLVRTSTMWHLGTRIEGELRDPDTTALDLALALHPTPAVCGWPTGLARHVIAETEPFDRDYFTGAVGWCDSEGDGEWVVALRCAEVQGAGLRLFAGAGIVPGSDPDSELAETSAKLRTFLTALGVEGEA